MPTSSVQDNLGRLHISAGTVTYSAGGVPALVTNDGSASIADTGTGNATITWADEFTSAPEVGVARIKATHSNQQAHTVTVEQLTTTTMEIVLHSILDGGANSDVTTADPAADDGFSYVAIGLRNN